MRPEFEQLLGSAVSAALVLFIIYRRFRRSFGRQRVSANRMVLRMVILAILGCLIAPAAVRSTNGALALSVGLVLGLGLGVFAGQRTRFERQQEELYYIPHTYSGMLVSALFLGRLLYRFVVQHQQFAPSSATPQSPDAALAVLYQNPVTLGVFFILIGYYLYYYGYVLWESKHLKPADLESPPANG
ncbi:MAG TPA: hypothetical protein VII70_07690 [Steroidobacteraceae bacterium]